MACTRPIYGRRDPKSGKAVFRPSLQQILTCEEIVVPCGQCTSCRLERSRQWAMRCMHEASLHEQNSFVTLTYDDDQLPTDGSVKKQHFRRFMNSLRQHLKRDHNDKRIKFFGCGEYGDTTQRPHYHLIIFGHDFEDKEYYSRSKDGQSLYTSERLSSIWQRGYCPIGDVSFESAAYVARYSLKKVTGIGAKTHYRGKEPEFLLMSRGGREGRGIGYEFLQKWQLDIYPHDYCIVNGKKVKPPKYYDSQLPEEYLAGIKETRLAKAEQLQHNFTDYHLAAREAIQNQRQTNIKRDQI